MKRGDPRRYRGHGLAIILEEDRGITLNGSDASAWADQSGSGYDVNQVTASAQPAYTAGVANGRPALVFVRADSQTLFRSAANLFAAGPYSIVFAWKLDVSTDNTRALVCSNGLNGVGYSVINTGTRAAVHFGNNFNTDSAVQTTSPEVWTTRRAAAAAPAIRVNGVDQSMTNTTTTMTDPGASAVLSIAAKEGTADFNDIKAFAVYAFTQSLPDSVTIRIEKRTKARYAIS